MSIEKVIPVTCPDCGNVGESLIWESLNCDLDPMAKQKLFKGLLFNYKCPKCGVINTLDYPMLYHDMKHKAMIYYVNSEEDVSTTYKNISEAKNDVEKIVQLDEYIIRIVTSHNSLREKAIIFDNELDDKVIEILKLFYISELLDQHPDMEIDEVLFLIDNGNYCLEFLSDEVMGIVIDKGFYEEIKKSFGKRFSVEDTLSFEVDIKWAVELLHESK